MNYWMCRGKPALNDWNEMLQPGRTDKWYTRRTPKSVLTGDRVFIWESSPGRRLIGLGVIQEPRAGKDKDGNDLFELQYLTRPFPETPTISELQGVAALRDAAFLKGGPATTLLALSVQHAEVLFEIAATHNPGLQMEEIWPDFANRPVREFPFDMDSVHATEGKRLMRKHLYRERDRRIISKKRDLVMNSTGRLACEVCGFDFAQAYGELGGGFCEVHHKLPLSEIDSIVETRLDDLAVVCSNCHRMIHRSYPPKSISELRSNLRKT